MTEHAWDREGSMSGYYHHTKRILWQQKWYEEGIRSVFEIVQSSDEPDLLHLTDGADNEMDITRDEARRLAGILSSWADGTLGMPTEDSPYPDRRKLDHEDAVRILRDAARRNDVLRVMMRYEGFLRIPYVYVVWGRPYEGRDLMRFQDDCGELGRLAEFASTREDFVPAFSAETVYVREGADTDPTAEGGAFEAFLDLHEMEKLDDYDERIVLAVRRRCDPEAVWILYNPPEDESDDWYLGSDVQVCIVVGEGDSEKIRHNVNFDLAMKHVDAYTAVYTPEDFEECSSIGGTLANDAVRNGHLAYRRGGYRSLR